MKVSVDELVDRVKANMEELTDSFDADIVMTAGIGVERYIREKMPDALPCLPYGQRNRYRHCL